jgi:hypothetical protein
MGWLVAVVLKPWLALGFFGFSCAVAYAIRPLIPDGRVKKLLYDRTFRHRHPWLFKTLVVVGCYGTLLGMVWYFNPR